VALTTHSNILSKLGMRRAIPLRPLCACMAHYWGDLVIQVVPLVVLFNISDETPKMRIFLGTLKFFGNGVPRELSVICFLWN
jgi:hypothetical protein